MLRVNDYFWLLKLCSIPADDVMCENYAVVFSLSGDEIIN